MRTSYLLLSLVVAILAIGLASCGVSSVPPIPVGDFNLSISSQSLFVPIGSGAETLQVSVQPTGGFNQPVTVSLSGLPEGVTSTPSSPFTLAPGGSQTVTFSAARGIFPGVSTITVAGIARGSETSLSHSGMFSLSAAAPVYAYTRSDVANSVLGYSVDANTGALAPLKGSPFAASAGLVVKTEQGAVMLSFLLSPIGEVNGLASYVIDPATGSLTPGQIINDDTLRNSIDVSPNPNGKFLHVVMPDCIRAYLIDPANGNLTLSSCSTVPATPWHFVVVPPGNVAYAAVGGLLSGTQVYLFSVNQNDGSLTLVQSSKSPFPFYGVWHCGGVVAFGIDQQTAGLTPFPLSGGCVVHSITFDPAGRYEYVTNGPNPVDLFLSPKPASISGYSCDSSGCSSPVTGSPFATQLSPQVGVVEPSQGKFLIEVIGSSPYTLTSFVIDAHTGALSEVPGTTIALPNKFSLGLQIVAMP